MSAAIRHRRGLLGRPFLLFGLLLLIPALAFGILGWQSVRRERSLAEREAVGEARSVLARRLDAVAQDLASLAGRESERPYFHYQAQHVPEDTVFQQLDFQATPLARVPEDSRVLGWFEWELGAKGAPERPQTFGPWTGDSRDGLLRAYGSGLRRTLAETAARGGAPRGRRVVHPLRVVLANEERGQLIEEIQITQQGGTAATVPTADAATTPYLKNFYARVGEEPVGVRYGSFRYRAYAGERSGPPLVAWRVVWIPASHAERREVKRERWLLQGYALDPTRSLPSTWVAQGAVKLCRRDCAGEAAIADPRSHEASLTEVLDAELVGDGKVVAPPAALTLVAIPDAAVLDAAYVDSRTRFFLLLGGVFFVVGVGFVVITRGLRREVALARRKEDFIAAVTHELKTPLAGIRMYADMLREGWVADEASADRYATRIIDESDRLGHLVDQVLDLAALERGVARPDVLDGDLGQAVREAVALMEARADRAGVALSVEVGEDLPLVPFDPKLVRPLVLNLLDNAIKYSENAPAKEVRVTVASEDRRVVLRVADRGVGIDPKVRRHVFEPFQRAGDENTRTAKGVGIGLALVKRYADAHRARVTLESAVGEGTTITVRFPLG